MRITGLAALAAIIALPVGAEQLGWSLAISNDSIGQGRDRWQSSSIQFGLLRGDAWSGAAPTEFGRLLEYRLRSDILTPERLDRPRPDDRRHAGVIAFGLHSYQSVGASELRLGGDVFVIGPQTGLLGLQEDLHDVLGFTIPELDRFQIDDTIRGQVSAEFGRTWTAGDWQIRPFVEAQVGPEDLLRAGVDLTWGAYGQEDLLLRTATTGHRVRGIEGGAPEDALSFVLGADVAYVDESLYLPEDLGYELTPVRTRVRGGLQGNWRQFDLFYGLAWLDREFEAQRQPQFVGTLQVGLRF